jgi:hypothetical protein
VKHKSMEKEFEVCERTLQVGQGKVRRQVAIASLSSFRQLRAEAHFGQGSMVRFFISDNRSQRILHFDVC